MWKISQHSEAATRGVIWKKVFLEILQNSQYNKNAAGLRPMACNFIKKETLAQVFSYEFCKISKNIFFTEHLWPTDSEHFLGSSYLFWKKKNEMAIRETHQQIKIFYHKNGLKY